jgi:2-polyprenyl-3-methyl-5-hydroxy-6-metoxy-1,4-benzoquinol methylase
MKRPADIRKEGRMPTVEELEEFYEAQATPRPGDGWTPSNQHIDTGFGRTKFALEHIESGMSVLECGTQDGGMSRHLIAAILPDGHYTGIDISSTYIERAGAYLDEVLVHAHVTDFHVADANTFSTRRRYDVIVAMEIMEHVPDPRQLLRNLWRLLYKRGGKILITVPKDWADSEGEHLHDFHVSDIVQIVGEATGIRPPVWQEGPWLFAVVDRDGVPYEP